jgi:hypothetical protein
VEPYSDGSEPGISRPSLVKSLFLFKDINYIKSNDVIEFLFP